MLKSSLTYTMIELKSSQCVEIYVVFFVTMHLYLYNNLLSIIVIVVAGKVQEYLGCSSCRIDRVFIIIDYNNFHVISIDVSNVETMVIVLVGEQFIFTL